MSTDYSRALGARLRAIRNQQGLSLQGVEDKSHGRWKAVVVGSYERGDRAVTVQRLSELAVFYGVPVSELLPDPRPSSAVTTSTKIVLNLESLGSLPADEAGPLARYASTIQAQRHDYNGKVLSIRTEDLKSLAIIYDMSPDELTTRLIEWGVLSPGMEGIVEHGRRPTSRTTSSTPTGSAAAPRADPTHERPAASRAGLPAPCQVERVVSVQLGLPVAGKVGDRRREHHVVGGARGQRVGRVHDHRVAWWRCS